MRWYLILVCGVRGCVQFEVVCSCEKQVDFKVCFLMENGTFIQFAHDLAQNNTNV